MPSCSAYAREAVLRYGAWYGGWLAVMRLARCHPLSGAHGFDPVPLELRRGAWYMPWRSVDNKEAKR